MQFLASNVPTDMVEDKIREFFGRIGFISSFRYFLRFISSLILTFAVVRFTFLVFYELYFRIICDKDKDSGKTKVYAVCEYKDQETALNAVKTLSTIEIAGRFMKVDHALNEKSRLEMICKFDI